MKNKFARRMARSPWYGYIGWALLTWVAFSPGRVEGQPGQGDHALFRGFFRHPTGERCGHRPPEVGFVAYLNGATGTLLTDQAPRWAVGADPNIPGTDPGTFNIELGNLQNPAVALGDSFFIRLTCFSSQSQIRVGDSIASLAALALPGTHDMNTAVVPQRPQNVSVIPEHEAWILTWDSVPNMTYEVYRRSLFDQLATGEARRQYERVGAGISSGLFEDTSVMEDSIYRYIVIAINGEGVHGIYSAEVPGEPEFPFQPIVPEGFQIEPYITDGIDHPSGMAWGPNGRLFVSEVLTGEIKIILDSDGDGHGDGVKVFASGFHTPVGLAWRGDSLYVSDRGNITIIRDTDGDDVADLYDPIISGWATFWHQNNQLIFDEEGYFFVALGAWADRTTGPSEHHNKILRISPDGLDIQIWAEGIRNVFDLAISPQGYMFGGDNGWQEGDHQSHPEELNYFAEGRHYGYPEYAGQPPPGTGTFGPLVEFPAHTAITGVHFYSGEQFPEDYLEDLYVAFYGPDIWEPSFMNRAYRIVRCAITDSTVTGCEEFANNFYAPVDIIQDADGAMYIADIGGVFFRPDSVAGHIYKITYPSATMALNRPPRTLNFELERNYPNPFNPVTTLAYTLASAAEVSLTIHDIRGRMIDQLPGGYRAAGRHTTAWDAAGVSSGVYYARLQVGRRLATEKLLVLK